MKVSAIAHKRSVMKNGRRFQTGDEAACDEALTEAEKKRYASLGYLALEKVKKGKDAKVQLDDKLLET